MMAAAFKRKLMDPSADVGTLWQNLRDWRGGSAVKEALRVEGAAPLLLLSSGVLKTEDAALRNHLWFEAVQADPVKAMELWRPDSDRIPWQRALPNMRFASEGMALQVLNGPLIDWSRTTAQEAMEILRSALPDGLTSIPEVDPDLKRFIQIANTGPGIAEDLVEALRSGGTETGEQTAVLHRSVTDISGQDPAVAAWLLNSGQKLPSEVLSKVVYAAGDAPSLTADTATQLLLALPPDVSADERRGMAEMMTERLLMLSESTDDYLGLADGIIQQSQDTELTKALSRSLAMTDPTQALSWLSRLDGGPLRNAAALGVIDGSLANEGLTNESAQAVALITAPQQQWHAIEEILRHTKDITILNSLKNVIETAGTLTQDQRNEALQTINGVSQ